MTRNYRRINALKRRNNAWLTQKSRVNTPDYWYKTVLWIFILFYRIKTQNNALKYDAWLTQKLRVFHAEITREKRVKTQEQRVINAWLTRD